MRRNPLAPCIVGIFLTLLASPAVGQDTTKVPPISARKYTGGSVTIKVTGTFTVDQEVKINTSASLSDGEMTWLQFGSSGSDTANALISFEGGSYGVNVGLGKITATAETERCTGKTEVTETLISGHYTCKNVISYDASTKKMGKVDVEVRFTAKT